MRIHFLFSIRILGQFESFSLGQQAQWFRQEQKEKPNQFFIRKKNWIVCNGLAFILCHTAIFEHFDMKQISNFEVADLKYSQFLNDDYFVEDMTLGQ